MEIGSEEESETVTEADTKAVCHFYALQSVVSLPHCEFPRIC